jgi:hypothetical protein
LTKEQFLATVKKVDGLGGMNVNERLLVTGLLDTFDKAMRQDKESVRFILATYRVDIT